MGHDSLSFMKDAIVWNAFPPLLKDIYHNDTEHWSAPAEFGTLLSLFM